VSPNIVTAGPGVIAIESEKQRREAGELVIATAVEFHRRAVWANRFEDGNGQSEFYFKSSEQPWIP
jgi:hypothetical protein